MGSKQLGFGDYEQSTGKKRTRRERFLGEMENVVPWKALIDLIEPHYPKTSSKGGRPPYPLATSPICDYQFATPGDDAAEYSLQ
jgi:IS5 family transposase